MGIQQPADTSSTGGDRLDLSGNNPIKQDPKLKSLLEKVDGIQKRGIWNRWRISFLDRYELLILDGNSMDCANNNYISFTKSMDIFVNNVNIVNDAIECGDLSAIKSTVRARNRLAEMIKTLTAVIDELEALIPQTGQMEKIMGHSKFHMGAVLVRDGFSEYERLKQCDDIIRHMRNVSLDEIVTDRQIIVEMERYEVKLRQFCDIMADLGIYKVMLKCREFDNRGDDDDDDDDGLMDEIVFCNLKTGGMAMLTRGDFDIDDDTFVETATKDDVARDRIIKLLLKNAKLGIQNWIKSVKANGGGSADGSGGLSGSSTHGAGGSSGPLTGNPLQNDHTLKKMIQEELDAVKTRSSFDIWMKAFLERYETYWEEDAMNNAKKAYDAFRTTVETFAKLTKKVEIFVDKGELTIERCTVKARNCIAEMNKRMTIIINELDELIPKTGQVEKNRGYNKFHMGGVMVRDGFTQYELLYQGGEVLRYMKNVSLGNVIDKQILEEMERYLIKLQQFCDIMNDLGLYKVMQKCRELFGEDSSNNRNNKGNGDNNNNGEDGDDENDENKNNSNKSKTMSDIVFLDIKMGGIGILDKANSKQTKVLQVLDDHVKKMNGDKDGGFFKTEGEEKEQYISMIVESPVLGLLDGSE